MKFRTFRILGALGVLGAIGGGVAAVTLSSHDEATHEQVSSRPQPPPPTPGAERRMDPTVPDNSTLKRELEAFLAEHPRSEGKSSWPNCMPAASFRATAVKFGAEDHAKYSSNDPSLWSQLKLDFNRDGIDDAKVLLKDGHPFKLERLGPDGKQVVGPPEYFE